MECQSLLPGRNKKHRAKSHEFTLKVRKTPASELASRQPNSMHDKGRYRVQRSALVAHIAMLSALHIEARPIGDSPFLAPRLLGTTSFPTIKPSKPSAQLADCKSMGNCCFPHGLGWKRLARKLDTFLAVAETSSQCRTLPAHTTKALVSPTRASRGLNATAAKIAK